MKHSFNISMDAEAKKAGDIHKVTLDISFEGVPQEVIEKHAMANMTVAWQNQIRNNWDKFEDGKLPEVVTFGDPLFESRKAAPISTDSAKKFIESLPEDQRAAFIASLGK